MKQQYTHSIKKVYLEGVNKKRAAEDGDDVTVKNIIVPYVKSTRGSFEDDTPALVIIDNFKGQITSSVTDQYPCLPPAAKHDWSAPTYGLVSEQASVRFPEKAFQRLVIAASDQAIWREGHWIDWLTANQLESTCAEGAGS